jgi:hypothetical protein
MTDFIDHAYYQLFGALWLLLICVILGVANTLERRRLNTPAAIEIDESHVPLWIDNPLPPGYWQRPGCVWWYLPKHHQLTPLVDIVTEKAIGEFEWANYCRDSSNWVTMTTVYTQNGQKVSTYNQELGAIAPITLEPMQTLTVPDGVNMVITDNHFDVR